LICPGFLYHHAKPDLFCLFTFLQLACELFISFLQMYGQAPLVLRHIDHGRNEDANDLEFDHQQSHFSAGGSGVGGSAVGNDDVVNPAEFGIHHVNMERNQLRRFQGSDVGGLSYHQIPVPNQPGSRVF
jgi:hypothetical protein